MSQQFQANISAEQKSKILFQMTELAFSESAILISSMIASELKITVNSIGVNASNDVDELLNFDDMLAVCHPVEGACPGNISFSLKRSHALILIKEFLNELDHLTEMSEMEEETLTDLGNIIVNKLLSHYMQVLHVSLNTLTPVLKFGDLPQIVDELCSDHSENSIFMVKFSIEIKKYNFSAYILWTDCLCQFDSILHETSKVSDM